MMNTGLKGTSFQSLDGVKQKGNIYSELMEIFLNLFTAYRNIETKI